jgi:hypothetical protein
VRLSWEGKIFIIETWLLGVFFLAVSLSLFFPKGYKKEIERKGARKTPKASVVSIIKVSRC